MWKNRGINFIKYFFELKGIKARVAYLIWGMRKLLQYFYLSLQSKLRFRGNAPKDVAPNVAYAAGIEKANMLGYIYNSRLKLVIRSQSPQINLVLPSISPGIIFGGYISFFSLASRLIAKGYSLRFIVTEQMSYTQEKLIELLAGFPNVSYALRHATIVRAFNHEHYEPIAVSKEDVFVAYSAFTALLCHHATREIGKDKFIFYIQEEEGHFHPSNSFQALIKYIYTLPHHAVFNSSMLANYFKMSELGVFNPSVVETQPKHLVFRHALSNKRHPSKQEIANRSCKKLLFFARPEQHAERNLFELGLVALRFCCERNFFKEDEWEFHAIGAMHSGFSLKLSDQHQLKFLPRLPLDEYAELLLNYDLGLSLMYAPHPSVPNFEMAAAGMPTVTTTFVNRSKEEMESICPNFITVSPDIESLIEGIKEAISRVKQYDERVKNAQYEWPRNWDETFTSSWLQEFAQLI